MADEKWMNYRDAGEMLGITAEAARHRARRFRWPTQKDNDGKALILVPADEHGRTTAERLLSGRPEKAVQPADERAVQTPVQQALSDLIIVLKDQLAKAEAGREQDREADRAELAKVEAMLKAEGERHAADIAWHRAEIERLSLLLSRPWWRKILG